MTDTEFNIRRRLKKIRKLILKFIILYSIIGLIGLKIPLGFIPKAGKRIHGEFSQTLPNQIGMFNYVAIILIIMAVVIGILLYETKYFDLKKDLIIKSEIKLAGIITKVNRFNDVLGSKSYKIWISNKKHKTRKIVFPSNLIKESKISAGQKIEIAVTSNAYYPTKFKSLENGLNGISGERVNDLMKIIESIKSKS